MLNKVNNLDEESAEVALTVRVPKQTLDYIDGLVKARPTKIPRHSWLLEAIYEKLSKEGRVKGTLRVMRENDAEAGTTPIYCLDFLSVHHRKGVPVAPMTLVGNDSIERYLIEWGCTAENAKGWIQKLKTERSVWISDVMVPTERLGPFGFKVAGLGIYRKLPDGRTAILYHNHPKNSPEETRGDRILIISASGHIELEATVTIGGKVLVLLEKHIFPPSAPNTVHLTFREASEEEAEEFLNIHRQYTFD
jgi:hypothetical protein